MYWAIIPKESMINEKPRPIKPTIDPKPANGTPTVNQIIDNTMTAKKKNALKKTPKNEIHIKGVAL